MKVLDRVDVLNLKERELGYLISPVRVLVKKNLPTIKVGSVEIEQCEERDLIEIPRWVAEVLSEAGFVEIQEEPFDLELFKTLSRERIQGPLQLSTLKGDFYLRMKRHLNYLKVNEVGKEKYEKDHILSYDLITIRASKLLSNACGAATPVNLIEKITPEEERLFTIVKKLVEDWRRGILEGG